VELLQYFVLVSIGQGYSRSVSWLMDWMFGGLVD